jgi:hypothetical protein
MKVRSHLVGIHKGHARSEISTYFVRLTNTKARCQPLEVLREEEYFVSAYFS